MKNIFEVSTTDYEKNKELVSKDIEDLQKLCETKDGYQFTEPMSRFGWTFFKLWIKPNLFLKIAENFSEKIKKAKGSKQNEKFSNFMTDFFVSNGCDVKLKLIEED